MIPGVSEAAVSTSPVIHDIPMDPPNAGSEASMSPGPAAKILSKEEKVEYRDQDGNLLDPEQVKSLEGKVEFRTKYETKTRLVDEEGNELPMPEGGWPEEFVAASVAPPHPDVHGVDKETVRSGDAPGVPKDAARSRDGEKEAEHAQAKPASENQEATVRDEL